MNRIPPRPNGNPRSGVVIPDGSGSYVQAQQAVDPVATGAQLIVISLVQQGIPDFTEALAKRVTAQEDGYVPSAGEAMLLEVMECVAAWQIRARALVLKAKALEEANE